MVLLPTVRATVAFSAQRFQVFKMLGLVAEEFVTQMVHMQMLAGLAGAASKAVAFERQPAR